jgi:hypothetical protein
MNPALIPTIAEKGKEIQAKEKKIFGRIAAGAIVILSIVLIWKFGKAIAERIRENQFDKNGGSQVNEWVNRIHSALHEWFTEDEQACYDVAKEIGLKKIFAKVNKAYKNKFQVSAEDDLQRFFNADELRTFYSYLK